MSRAVADKLSTSRQNEAQPAVACPFCHSQDTACEAAFGTAHAYAQFYCRACRTPFEWIKWEEHSPAGDLPDFLKS
jgi:hypothetical protein